MRDSVALILPLGTAGLLLPWRRSQCAVAGTDGNERLTAITAVVLIVLLAVEGVTILAIQPLLSVARVRRACS